MIVAGIAIGLPLLTVGGYVIYVTASYHRIGDADLEITARSSKTSVPSGETLRITSYNIGFGAYSDQYTFFMDEGYDSDGNPTSGHYGKGMSKEDVEKNTAGSLEAAEALSSDFYLFQDVDQDSDRAYHINQRGRFEEAFPTYDASYCVNFDSVYLFYPLYDPHGKSLSGLLTLSAYSMEDAKRKEYTVSDSFSKFFDLDRCFAIYRYAVDGGKELVVINSHMSAYDEGGSIRNKQIQELKECIESEYQLGNYVIVGGDFNHDLLTCNPTYAYTRDDFAYKDQVKQKKPDWLHYMFDEDGSSPFSGDFTIYASDNEPSCRDADTPYERGTTFVSTVDGFVCSNNVSVSSVYTTKTTDDTPFAYSDHQPTTLTFSLN